MSPLCSTFTVHRSAVVAQALHHQLEATAHTTSAGWATSAADALYRHPQPPDVWIVDDRLARSGATVLCDRLNRRGGPGHILVLAALDGTSDVERVLPMVERGVRGVVDVSSSWPLLLEAVQAVAIGETWLPRRVASDLSRSMLLTRAMDDLVIGSLLRLTQRERQVLLLLCRGHSRSEVSEALQISAHTARTHVQRVIKKFGVHSQSEVLALGLKHRLADRFEGC